MKTQETEAEKTEAKCNQCGDCCRTTYLPFTHQSLAKLLEDSALPEGGRSALVWEMFPTAQIRSGEHEGMTWLDFLEPIVDAEKWFSISRMLRGEVFPNKPPPEGEELTFRCSLLKENEDGTGSCSIHEDKPDICKSFNPADITPVEYLPSRCSYLDWFKDEWKRLGEPDDELWGVGEVQSVKLIDIARLYAEEVERQGLKCLGEEES